MGKYIVTFSCGHEEKIELFGKIKDRMRTIEYYENNYVCKKCYYDQLAMRMAAEYDELRVPYSEYCNKYKDNKTKKGSYNGEDKTIIVYIPKKTNLCGDNDVDDSDESAPEPEDRDEYPLPGYPDEEYER